MATSSLIFLLKKTFLRKHFEWIRSEVEIANYVVCGGGSKRRRRRHRRCRRRRCRRRRRCCRRCCRHRRRLWQKQIFVPFDPPNVLFVWKIVNRRKNKIHFLSLDLKIKKGLNFFSARSKRPKFFSVLSKKGLVSGNCWQTKSSRWNVSTDEPGINASSHYNGFTWLKISDSNVYPRRNELGTDRLFRELAGVAFLDLDYAHYYTLI